jgi:glycosyltransferase involved in cell wall biosynthesis
MAPTARVAIDAYAADLPYQTGLGVYGRSLAKAYRAAGLPVAGLFGRPVSVTSDLLLTEMRFHRKSFKSLSPADRVRLFVTAFTGRARASEIANSGNVQREPIKNVMQHFDSVLNSTNVFINAARHFKLTGRFLSVKLPKDIQLMHWTMPLPLRAVGIVNIYTIPDVIPVVLPYATLGNPSLEMKLLRNILDHADQVVTISEHSRNDIGRIFDYDVDRICNTYLAREVDPDAMAESDRDVEIHLEQSERLAFQKYLAYVGSIEPRKNIDRLLDAYFKADTTLPLVICSNTGWLNDETLARLDDAARSFDLLRGSPRNQHLAWWEGKRIVRVQNAGDTHIARLIRGARALVYPSFYEGFGLPVLEAMQLGTPVITARASSTAEIAADACVLVDPFSVTDLALALDRVCRDDALCSQLAEAGMRRAMFFSEDAFNKRIGALVDRALAPAGRQFSPRSHPTTA